MQTFWLKSKKDKEKFKFFQTIGFPVIEIEDLEKTDYIIEKLIKENCKTIILSNEVASFSQDIIKKYNKEDEINIIITSK